MGPGIDIRLRRDNAVYTPGEPVEGTVHWHNLDPNDVRRAELSVLWYTEGKGDVDTGVAHYEEMNVSLALEHPFRVVLPLLPLTYHGELIKIHWVVRVRLDMRRGKDPVFECSFTVVAPEVEEERYA